MGVGIFLFYRPEQILKKIKSFSHGEFNNGELDMKNIEERILKMKIFLKEVIL